MILITSPVFEEHVTPPGHPERLERAHVFDAVAARWLERGGRTMPPRAASREELERVHDAGYVDLIAGTSGQAVRLDPDTFTSSDSWKVALLAAGAAVDAAAHALEHGEPAFALVRPPGHHAERDRAMGFCLFNNAAVAAAAMIVRGLRRVAVIDIDVHHGNGTQRMFYSDPRVLYVSTHQHPFYPGTGAADEVGAGDGQGFTVNLPMEAGSGDADYDLAYRAVVEPILQEYAPDLLIVSAGFDAHERDPLASMRVTTAAYVDLVARLAAQMKGRGQLALVTEGGYEMTALAGCLEGTIAALDVLSADGTRTSRTERENRPATRGERAVRAARAALKPYWRGI